MTGELPTIRLRRATGDAVEGEALMSSEGFSPRYDLDRWSGEITKAGHSLQGRNIKGRICFFPTAKGGIAAGWAFSDIKAKNIAPLAFVFGVTNPVMVQGAVFAGITLTEGWDRNPQTCIHTGDWVRVDPTRKLIEVLRRAS